MGVNAGVYADAARGAISGNCYALGCNRYRFRDPYGYTMTFNSSPCVSERVGASAYTDVGPSGAPVGKVYPAPTNPCLASTMLPLSSNKAVLNAQIDLMEAGARPLDMSASHGDGTRCRRTGPVSGRLQAGQAPIARSLPEMPSDSPS